MKRKTRLELLTADGAAAIEAVRSGLAHVGVGAADFVPDDLVAHALMSVGQVLVARRQHSLARRRHLSMGSRGEEDLEGATVAVYVLARARSAICRCAGGGIILSLVATRLKLGFAFRAGELTAPPSASTPQGTCESAMKAA